MQPIFLKPVLQEKIWGGNKLATEFHLDLPSDSIGEAWCISAHKNGVSQVISPAEYQGLGLDVLYQSHPELFGPHHPDLFPLLVKILDAKEDLSVQVHPNDEYGMAHEGEMGKTECWYIISAEEDAKIIYGHQTNSKEEFLQLVEEKRWAELWKEVPVKAGEFYSVPAGTVHAIGAGIVILETQQSSDTTYRLYDYDRTDAQGQPRELHIRQSSEVIPFPDFLRTNTVTSMNQDGGRIDHLLTNEYFSVYRWVVSSQLTPEIMGDYTLATVVKGSGELRVADQSFPLKLADSFILPYGEKDVTLLGQMELIISYPENPKVG